MTRITKLRAIIGDRMDDLDAFRSPALEEPASPSASDSAEEPLPGILTEPEIESEEPVNVADKLSPAGETEKMGVDSPGLKPRPQAEEPALQRTRLRGCSKSIPRKRVLMRTNIHSVRPGSGGNPQGVQGLRLL